MLTMEGSPRLTLIGVADDEDILEGSVGARRLDQAGALHAGMSTDLDDVYGLEGKELRRTEDGKIARDGRRGGTKRAERVERKKGRGTPPRFSLFNALRRPQIVLQSNKLLVGRITYSGITYRAIR
jgi:hypothetical protein